MTTFPEQIQTFPTMKDITETDAPIVSQYQQAMLSGNFSLAAQILQTIPEADSKIVSADLINTISDTSTALERYYLTKYSPAYIVSATQPAEQEVTDFWFKVVE